MRWNVPSCCEWQLYVIIDAAGIRGRALTDIASAAIRGGADVLQLRHKAASAKELFAEADTLLPLASAGHVPLIINDQVDVARAVCADGVHLGQTDLPVAEARQKLGPSALIGKSTHSLEQALAAEAEGASYLGLGPIFPTPTKPDYGSIGPKSIRAVLERITIPVVCIGGIDQRTLPHLLRRGARCVAVVRAVCAAEDPERATRSLKEHLTQFSRSQSPRTL